MKRNFDMVIIGGGPGGYTAALYAARAGLEVVVLEKLSAGGQMALTSQIDNYPGFEEGIDGFLLGEKMQAEIMKVREEKDSVGGILESVVTGLPAGLGEPWFDSIESKISHAMFSIGGVKGIEFGKGFELSDMKGSEANDAFRMKDGKVVTETNNSGGINGGITNGMPLMFSLAIKPTPSIFRKQNTVDFVKGENAEIELKGRHDPCIVHRAKSVADALTAIVLADVLTGRYGTDYLAD